jgi:membrane protein required for colicin V production
VEQIVSQWTYLDYVFALIVLVSTGFALTKGIAREIISLVALVGGLILAAWYYPSVARWFIDFSRSDAVASLLGFMIIFLGCLLAGAVVAFFVNRFVKMSSLQWVDRLLGGLYGFIRGWAVASIIVLALIAFPVRPEAVPKSHLAPYLLAGARAAVLIVPSDLKDKFSQEYQKVLRAWNEGRNPQ